MFSPAMTLKLSSNDKMPCRGIPLNDVLTDITNTIIINVGGTRHEVTKQTLQAIPDSKLANIEALHNHYRKTQDEYYFDRHPGIFNAILNFYRTGELHMPQDVCGPSFKLELDYWGLEEFLIQECCWIKYNVDKETRNTLDILGRGTLSTQLTDDGQNQCGARCTNWYKVRNALWECLDNPLSSKGAKAYAVISFLLSLLSIAVFCAETHPDLAVQLSIEDYAKYYGVDVNELHHQWYQTGGPEQTAQPTLSTDFQKHDNLTVPNPYLIHMDNVLIMIFTVDLLVRFVACPKKLRFFTIWVNVTDALSILPFYVELIVEEFNVKETYRQNFLDALFTLKVLRIFRIMRMLRHYKGLQVLVLTLKYSWKELLLLAVFLFISCTIFASLIFFANKDEFFRSIPHAYWWAIVTMTTVGYGDMHPTTDFGYVIGSFCAVCGVLVIAFTVPTLVNNFLMFYSHVQYRKSDRQRLKTTGTNGHVEQTETVEPVVTPVETLEDPFDTVVTPIKSVAITETVGI